MTVFATIAFAALLLEDDHLLTLHEGLEHLAGDFRTFYGRCAYCYSAVGVQKEHFVENYGLTLLHFIAEVVDIQIFALFGLELLSFDFYDSVHLCI